MNRIWLATILFLVTTLAGSAVITADAACTKGDENRAINIAKRAVGADRDTHIFVAVAQTEDCDDWVVYKRTPGKTGVTACIVTIENWEITDITCCPTGCADDGPR